LREIENQGLENAISLQGGIEYLTNLAEENNKKLTISIKLTDTNKGTRLIQRKDKTFDEISIGEINYTVTIATKPNSQTPFIPQESLDLTIRIRRVGNRRQLSFDDVKDIFVDVHLFVDPTTKKHSMNNISVIYPDKPVSFDLSELLPSPFFEFKFPDSRSILETPIAAYLFNGKLFDGIVAFDFDPKNSKRAAKISSRADLETDGSNSSIVLKNIFTNRREYQRFTNLVRDLLPFVEKMEIAPAIDKSVFFKMSEIFAKEKHLPSPLISDGTINVITLVIALFFQEKDVLVFEEPERNLHPALISKLLQLMRERSKSKQIIVTTHNTEMIRNAKIEEIIFVSRDINGSSIITAPGEKEAVRKFLENEIGLDELYISNLLT
jgi:hypothetical protein